MCWRLSDLRLRAWRLSACLLSYRAALSLPLVRYSVEVRLRGVLLGYSVIGSVPLSCSCVSASFDVVKAFQSMRLFIQSSIGFVRRCHVIQSHRVRPLSLCLPVPSSPSSACSLLAGECGDAASRLPCRLAARPVSRSPVPPSCPPDGEGRSVRGELGETARIPMIG